MEAATTAVRDEREAVLRVQRRSAAATLPARAHPSDAGLDLTAVAVERVRPGVYAFDTGISVQVSPGFYCEVVPRSSIVKTDFVQANSVGVIDPDYRGPIKVVLRYLGAGDAAAAEAAAAELVGARVAQLLVRRVEPCRVQEVATLDETVRGDGGFGSTGR